jgi:hypothetical protein
MASGAAMFLSLAGLIRAQIPGPYLPGRVWGSVEVAALREASGISCGWVQEGVVWTHNDGGREVLHALDAGGRPMANFTFSEAVGDFEELAAGPGPVAGTGYLYVGDIGGNASPGDVRGTVKIVRIPEPPVPGQAGGQVPVVALPANDVFTLTYPDGQYDAEAMIIDPRNADLYLFTKTVGVSRVYRANLNGSGSGAVVPMVFVTTVPFPEPSAAAISRDGGRILLRDEDRALQWQRGPGVSVADALRQAPVAVPVVGRPLEPNGEAIAFTADGSGYLTVSEGVGPLLYYFQKTDAAAPVLEAPLPARTLISGSNLQCYAALSGYPVPAVTWSRDGQVLAGQTGSVLTLTGVTEADEGFYEIRAVNASGEVRSGFVLEVQPRPLLRITEVQTAPGTTVGADWWELTSFEPRRVDLSGWRFNDETGDLSSAFVFPAGLVIEPGESVVFVDNRTAQQFRSWWGAGLPEDTKIVSYSGSGLALAPSGDRIRVWDATTTRVSDVIAEVVVGASAAGTTLGYSPQTGQFGGVTQAGVNGGYAAATGTDVGSPGRWLAPVPVPELAAMGVGSGKMRVGLKVERWHWYGLEAAADLVSGDWVSVDAAVQAAADGQLSFEVPVYMGSRFFRVRVR